MAKTQAEAEKLTSAMDQGAHHIGDFLPPEELSKFMNKYKVSGMVVVSVALKQNISWNIWEK